MKVTFLHPDFGIGGAERLVLDAAIALRRKGHQVKIVTNHFSKDHCFSELLSFEQDLEVANCSFPRTLFGKCYALCAFIRLCLAALHVCVYHRDSDVIFSDQISAPLPILRLLTNSALLFYCHFPDQLLTQSDTKLKIAYRVLIDRIESLTMRWADKILVNSHFTEGVVLETFPLLAAGCPLEVLYPPLNYDSIKAQCVAIPDHLKQIAEELTAFDAELKERIEQEKAVLFLSINRFEAKKNIGLAIHAFASLRDLLAKEGREAEFDKCYLILAGGYDKLNSENISYHRRLVEMVNSMGMQYRVKFVLSPSDMSKIWLLKYANLVIYTPDREHFGIVPLEAMFMHCPVLAVNSGGPKETVIDGATGKSEEATGFLREPEPRKFAKVMLNALDNPVVLRELGEAGRIRVKQNFSFDVFSERLHQIVGEMRVSRQ